MRSDFTTYRTATTASWLGLAVQLAIASSLTIYAVLNKDAGAMTSGIFAWGGVAVWLALAIVFDAHRRERVEAMEADALAQTGGANASVFQTQDDLRPAAKRLAGLHKYFIPIVAIIVGGVLVGIGAWRGWAFYEGSQIVASNDKAVATADQMLRTGPIKPLVTGVLGVLIAAVGFLVARYAAGMAKQTQWGNLRAGASFAAGSALLGLYMALGVLVDYLGPDTLVRYFPYVAAGCIVLIGVEILANFLLGIYRPRKAGEIPRAAFDSRLLGFVAAPDSVAKNISGAISYQLGFDVTGGWFYQLLSRSVLPLLSAGLVIVWLLSGIAVVQPHQRAMVLRFGKPVGSELGPGLHFKAPWPIDEIYVPEYITRDTKGRIRVEDRTVTGLRVLELATRMSASNEPILWTNDHPGEEVPQFVRANPASAKDSRAPEASPDPATPSEVGGLKRDELVDLAIVSVELPMHYVVSNVEAYDMLGAPEQRDAILKAVAQRESTRFFQGTHLDEVLGYGRTGMGPALRERIQAAFDALNPGPNGTPFGAGVKVVYVGISGVHPPKDAAQSFEAPVQADARKIANIMSAEADAAATLTQVVGEYRLAGQIVAELKKLQDLSTWTTPDAKAIAAQEFAVQQLIEQAGGKAGSTLAQARADRWKRHMDARGKAARYTGQELLFAAAPEVFLGNEYFGALRSIMNGSRVFVTGAGAGANWYNLDATDKDLGTDVFKPEDSALGR